MTDTDIEAPKRRFSRMPFDRPEEGWTRHAGLSTDDVSFRDSMDPAYFEDEMQAIFRRFWLHVGRDFQIPQTGDYFTRELPGLDVSILITRDKDGAVRAFYNMCMHRGNKLVWEGHPKREVCGSARRFTCKYHGWQYDSSGDLRLLNMQDWFFDKDKADYGLREIHCDVWEGFIFVNLAPEPHLTLHEQLAPFAEGLAGYPFDKLTHTYHFQVEAKANWKIFLDAMVEQYHGNTLHYKIVAPFLESPPKGAIGSRFEVHDRNTIWSVAVPAGSTDENDRYMSPIEKLFKSNLWGPANPPDIGLREFPPLLNHSRNELWTNDNFHVFPNMDMLMWKQNWLMVYSTWPIAVDRVLFEARMYFAPPRNASDRLAHERVAVEFKEFLLQDANLLECSQQMLNLGVKTDFPLCDEEVVVRNMHRTSQEVVAEWRLQTAR